MKSSTFWDITPGGPLKVIRRFGKISQARNKHKAVILVLFLGLFFDTEVEGDVFFRNVS
jgi:hypothetical protein